MNIRGYKERLEELTLARYAQKSSMSEGRKIYEEPDDMRTCYQSDRDRIIHSKAFRRLMYKTQVFISPDGDHYRTRLTHTLEVSQIARTISSALGLNEDLTESISLGHDLGHTPFGHLGEEELNKIVKFGFQHNEQSIRVVEFVENDGKGLNLTAEVLDGILNHRGSGSPKTLEGKIVQISDKIAYVNHDIDDSLRAGILSQTDLPREYISVLGETSRKRINFLIRNIVENSKNRNEITLDNEVNEALLGLRKFMFKYVYKGDYLQKENIKFENIISKLYCYYDENFEKIPNQFINHYNSNKNKSRVICDYIAGMTDRFAVNTYNYLNL